MGSLPECQRLGDRRRNQKDVVRAKKPKRLPVVYSVEEAKAIIDELTGIRRLMVVLLYGGGLRLMECVRLRVKDVDFANGILLVRDGKGGKDRRTPLPRSASHSAT